MRYGVIWVVTFVVLAAVGSTSQLEGLLVGAVVASNGMSIHFSTHVAFYLFTTLTGSLVTSTVITGAALAVVILRKARIADWKDH